MFNIFEQPQDIQEYIYSEWRDAEIAMTAGEVYCNTLGMEYTVLEDSPAGNIFVKVSDGRAISRLIPKVILVS